MLNLAKSAIEFYAKTGKLPQYPSVLEGVMKLFTIIVLAGLIYFSARFLIALLKELAEIAAEAWHSGEAEQ